MDGALYFTDTITFRLATLEGEKVFVVPAGARLDSVGGIPALDARIQEVPLRGNARWDSEKRRYYTTSLRRAARYGLENDQIVISSPDGSTFKHRDQDVSSVELLGEANSDSDEFSVQFADDLGLLYIRLPKMDKTESRAVIPQGIRYRGKQVQRVVIDARANGGGSDSVWWEVLEMLLPRCFALPTEVVTTVKNFTHYTEHEKPDSIPEIERSPHPFAKDYPNLCRYKYMYAKICPSDSSLRLDVPIYLLVDEYSYSSTLAFLAASRNIEQITSAGRRTGWFGGRIIDPIYFVLPNSKISFSVEPNVDLTGVVKEEDLLQDRPDAIYPISIQEKNRHRTYLGRRYDLDYMRKHDSLFKYVMEM